jgi:hypothetical protein
MRLTAEDVFPSTTDQRTCTRRMIAVNPVVDIYAEKEEPITVRTSEDPIGAAVARLLPFLPRIYLRHLLTPLPPVLFQLPSIAFLLSITLYTLCLHSLKSTKRQSSEYTPLS